MRGAERRPIACCGGRIGRAAAELWAGGTGPWKHSLVRVRTSFGTSFHGFATFLTTLDSPRIVIDPISAAGERCCRQEFGRIYELMKLRIVNSEMK